MSIEEVFIEKSLDRARLEEFLKEELEQAGYGGFDIRRTPMGTRVTIHVQRPGVVIGRGGRSIRDLTEKLSQDFDMDDPQVEVSEIEDPEFNASIMANRVAYLLTRGLYFRRVGYNTLRDIMEAGARGAEILISGKLTGDYAREERFYDGYLKKAGDSASKFVSVGQAVAKLPAGTVGVKVRIMPPNVKLPDEIEVDVEEEAEEEISEDKGEEKGEEKKNETDENEEKE
ncbi:30S ribosomal protein S3 [candidate division MSBL1 archaeon SCGC-AAA382M17]|uniref:Small ribosomal subunit protein uS3 n=1 Tax=candidate division MSBL1 archaeon SCGC-AAA382M17 TaxID=1698284 RepID=A0ABR5TJN6_9EURY|nr:30S ribosomal protein S3 [candidate division MSBL1 archaeon SCGC-AAA382M17]